MGKYLGKEGVRLLNDALKFPSLVTGLKYVLGTRDGKLAKMTTKVLLGLQGAGDIVFYDKEEGRKVVVDRDTFDASAYPIERYVPIGIIVIPDYHDVYGTGEGAMVSLAEMDYNNPDSGTVDEHVVVYFGGRGVQIMPKVFTECVICNDDEHNLYPYATGCGVVDNRGISLFTDSAEGSPLHVCPTDPLAFVDDTRVRGYDGVAPSPYLENRSRNPVYFQTESPSSEENCLSDFDGKGNTQTALDNVTVEGWETSETIENSNSSGSYPAFCCCWRFHTEGTEQGDWYLPSIGEFGYLAPRWKTINDVIDALNSAYGTVGIKFSSNHYRTSTEYDATNQIVASNYTLIVRYKSESNIYVRAFCRV